MVFIVDGDIKSLRLTKLTYSRVKRLAKLSGFNDKRLVIFYKKVLSGKHGILEKGESVDIESGMKIECVIKKSKCSS